MKIASTFLILALIVDNIYGWGLFSKGLPESEKEALIEIYQTTQGENWTNGENWLKSKDACEWEGVICEKVGDSEVKTVTELRMKSFGMKGRLPIFIKLKSSNNRLKKKEFGTDVVTLPNLKYVDFSGNYLTGQIHSSYGLLPQLEYLSLGFNKLNGSLLSFMGELHNLKLLDVFSNDLKGPLPPNLSNLKDLEILLLGNNEFEGEIPEEWKALKNLRILDMRHNHLTGTIPNFQSIEKICYLGNSFDQKSIRKYSPFLFFYN